MTTRPSDPQVASDPSADEESTRALLVEAKKRVGSTLRGKWKLERIIGVGGMGAVYEGRHRNGLRGAVKVLDSALARTSDCRARFLREGRLANEVDHVGAVRVLDDDETEDGSAFLVMELLDGVTLEQLSMMRGGTIPADELARYAAQVLDTLIAAHARGIVHRDIKPENLFVTDEGIVKILDFGIARMDGLGDSLRVTRAGEPIGTPAFMSPEQARGRLDDVDERTDVYSLGATLFTLVTGEPVHAEPTTVAELIAEVITKPARSVKQACADVPDAFAALVDRALQFDKSARFATAEEMRDALDVAYLEMTGEKIPATPTPTVTQAIPLVRRRWPRARTVKRALALVLPSTIAAAALLLFGAKTASPAPHRATEVAIVESAPPADLAPSAPVSVAAVDPVTLRVPAPVETAPRSVIRVAREIERRASVEPQPTGEPRASVPRVSWLSRRNPIYDRRN